MDLLHSTPQGMYCPQADVFIDPWRPVARALITHAHSDHARPGMGQYLAQHGSAPILRQRLGADIDLQTVAYGETVTVNGVRFSFHPAGHIVGSAQIRVEWRGEVWVVSGDYKLEADGLSAPFEPLRCHCFITESTFGLPIYRWQPQEAVAAEIADWWRRNAAAGKASLLIGYALGKAQRLLHALPAEGPGPVYAHGAILAVHDALRAQGVPVREALAVSGSEPKSAWRGALILAPPNAADSAWTRRFEPLSTGIASGWMALRGARRRRAADRGFVLSDHADWDGLNAAIRATGAERILVTHGYSELFSRWLCEQGYDARPLETGFEGEADG